MKDEGQEVRVSSAAAAKEINEFNHNNVLPSEEYYQKLKQVKLDKLKEYKSSQYSKMGKAIFEEYLK